MTCKENIMPNLIEITDFAAKELDVYARLNETQLMHYYEPQTGLFIAESPKVISRALDAGFEPVSVLLERKHIETQAKEILSRCGDIPVFTADPPVITQLTGYTMARGALCAMRRKPLPSVESVCAGARRIAVLENIMNSTNIGAIFRSAAALNMDAILLTPACSDPLYRRAVRVSMGTVFQVPWTYIGEESADWPQKGITKLREMGFATAAMALRENTLRIDDPCLAKERHLAIVLGTEGDGLADETIADCDYTVKIPMTHGVDSLNVAAAGAVAFWELGKYEI